MHGVGSAKSVVAGQAAGLNAHRFRELDDANEQYVVVRPT